MHGPSVVVVHHVFRPDAAFQVLEVGAQLPAHASALGKAMLAYASGELVEDLLAEPLAKLTRRTLAPRRAARASSRRSATAASPASATRRCSASRASPRRSSTTRATRSARSAWSATPTRILPRAPARELTTAVVEAARGISRELGARRWPGA